MSRKNSVRPLTAVLIIAVFAALLGARFWAHGQEVALTGFSHLHKHPSGDTVLLFHNVLYRFDDADELKGRTSLASLGVPVGQITDFAWFSNGDMLIRRGRQGHDLLFDLQRFNRQTNRTEEYTDNRQAQLVRCNNENKTCHPFSGLNLNDVFALDIDTQTDRVFVADTSRHRIYLLSPDGEEIDRIDTGLKFPNQIQFHDNHLFVANTNRHEISVYTVTDKGFGKEPKSISTVPPQAAAAGQTWPAAFTFMGKQLWVVNETSSMDKGGVYLFDIADGVHFLRRLNLTKHADPVALITHGKRVLVSDFSNDRIYQFDRQGNELPEFMPEWLQPDVVSLRDQRQYWRNLTRILTVVFVVSLLAGFAYAFYRDYGGKGEQANIHQALSVSTINISDPDIVWIEPDPKLRRNLLMIPGLIVVLVLAIYGLDHLTCSTCRSFDYQPLLFVALIVAGLIFVMMRVYLYKRIGVQGNTLIIVDHKGRVASGSGEDIRYTTTAIMIGDQSIMLGAQPVIYPMQQMVQHVYPLLRDAEYVPPSEMQRLMIRRSRVARILLILVVLGLVAMLAWLLR